MSIKKVLKWFYLLFNVTLKLGITGYNFKFYVHRALNFLFHLFFKILEFKIDVSGF